MVAMNVWPTDAGDGSVANEARWRKMARHWTASGVLAGVGSGMQPSLAFPNLTVKAGAAWVDGHYAELLGDQVLAVTANGIVVVRFDPAANTAELLYRDGITTPTQTTGGTWNRWLFDDGLGDDRPPRDRRSAGRSRSTLPAGGAGTPHRATHCSWPPDPYNLTSGGLRSAGCWPCPTTRPVRCPRPAPAAWLTDYTRNWRYSENSWQAASGGDTVIAGSALVALNPGDTIGVSVFHTHTGGFLVNSGSNDCYQGRWIGPS